MEGETVDTGYSLHSNHDRQLPVYPDNRTFSDFGGMSQMCHKATSQASRLRTEKSELNALLSFFLCDSFPMPARATRDRASTIRTLRSW
jgi:hypothetical protein